MLNKFFQKVQIYSESKKHEEGKYGKHRFKNFRNLENIESKGTYVLVFLYLFVYFPTVIKNIYTVGHKCTNSVCLLRSNSYKIYSNPK